MAKSKVVPAPAPTNPVLDARFQRFIKNATITAAEKDPDILTGRAAALVGSLSEEEVAEICECCFAETADDHDRQAMRGPFSGKIIDFIKNFDPAVKQAIIELILKYIGLKGDSSPPLAAAARNPNVEEEPPFA